MEQNYQNIEDFLLDDSFVSWAKSGAGEAGEFWEKWAAEHPESRELLEEAKAMVRGIPFEKASIDKQELDQQLARLTEAIGQESSKQEAKEISLTRSKKYVPLKWAAILLLLISSSFFIYQSLNTPKFKTHKTAFGETKEIVLEDGSRIFLNANSEFTHESQFKDYGIKELWLEGEAYFEFKPQERGNFYLIHAGEIDTRIIGTAFNLNTRKESGVLSLDEGKVLVSHLSGPKVELEAGFTTFFDKETQSFIKKSDRNKFWNSWREQIWMLDDETTFGDILERIEAEYGLKTELKNEALRHRSLDGSVSIENVEVLLESLSYIFEIEIKRAGDSVLYIE
ncbi:MAG: FecR domain-containing protein [Bacteroidota bacterium]